jgi:hypothetical protein
MEIILDIIFSMGFEYLYVPAEKVQRRREEVQDPSEVGMEGERTSPKKCT